MGEFDVSPVPVVAEKLAVEQEAVRVAAIRNRLSRAEAVELGRRAAGLESARRGEGTGDAKRRSDRAGAYAAWEWDGKPDGGNHLQEFGVADPGLAASRNGARTDFKQGKGKPS